MKLIKVYEIADPDHVPFLVSELWLNKDIIRWAHLAQNKKKSVTYTKLHLIADDKALNILETPEEINELCNKMVARVEVTNLDQDFDFGIQN